MACRLGSLTDKLQRLLHQHAQDPSVKAWRPIRALGTMGEHPKVRDLSLVS